MLFNVIFTLFLILNICLFVNSDINNNIDDKLVLSPMQLYDMVQKETMKKKHLVNRIQYTDTNHQSFSNHVSTTELDDDETRLKNRKVWSRWGKWGECSVTCGEGLMGRTRVCVAGRCANGEREEQTRPCNRPPCHEQQTTQMQISDAE